MEKFLYHATLEEYGRKILAFGPDLSLSRKGLDFGAGFYLGNNRGVALKYGENMKRWHFNAKCMLLTYLFDKAGLDGVDFPSTNIDWYNKVYGQRVLNEEDDYDYISGPVADSKMPQVFDDYREGRITDEELMERLASWPNSFQLVIKTEKAKQNLSLVKWEVF